MRILYVEDNMANLYLVKRVARIGQHDVINYIDAQDALANFDEDNPDLVLMDIQLAGEMGGLEAVEHLRARGYNVPIVAVTAYAMVGDRDRCLAAGCTDYLAKPLPIPQLADMFQRYDAAVTTSATPAAAKETPAEEATTAPAAAKETPAEETAAAPVTPAATEETAAQEVTPAVAKETAAAPVTPAAEETPAQEATTAPAATPAVPAAAEDAPAQEATSASAPATSSAAEDTLAKDASSISVKEVSSVSTMPSIPSVSRDRLSPPTKPTPGSPDTPAQTV